MLLAVDLLLIGWLTLHAYRDGSSSIPSMHTIPALMITADTLDRCELPFFGRLASSFVDDE